MYERRVNLLILKKQLLGSDNLNAAFLSKTATAEQEIASNLKLNGRLTLKTAGSALDDSNPAYLQIDPQGSKVAIYDGANDQRLDVLASNGSKSTYITTIDSTNIGLIDVTGVTQLEIGTNSGKDTKFGGNVLVLGTKQMEFTATGSAVPNAAGTSAGNKVILSKDANSNYGVGIESNSVWYTSFHTHKWYSQGGVNAAAPSVRMTLNQSGNLGIGMTPTYKLDVSGDARVSASLFAGTITSTSGNTGVLKIVSSILNTGLRTSEVTRNALGRPTIIEEKVGATVVKTTTITRDTSGRATTITEVAGGTTITHTVARDAKRIVSSITKT